VTAADPPAEDDPHHGAIVINSLDDLPDKPGQGWTMYQFGPDIDPVEARAALRARFFGTEEPPAEPTP
jgi:hypothetical protein